MSRSFPSIPSYTDALLRKRTPMVANNEGSDSRVNTSCITRSISPAYILVDEDNLATRYSVSGILKRTNYSNSESTVEHATPRKYLLLRKMTINAPPSPEYPIRNVGIMLTQSDDWLPPLPPQSEDNEDGEPIVSGETTNQDQPDPPSEDPDRQTETAASSDPADNTEDDDDDEDEHVSGQLSPSSSGLDNQADRQPLHSSLLSGFDITRFLDERCAYSDIRRSITRKINRQLKTYFANSYCETSQSSSIDVNCNQLFNFLKMEVFTDEHTVIGIVFNALLEHYFCDITRCPPDAILTSDIREYLRIFVRLMIRPTFDLSPLFNLANDVINRYDRKNKFYATLIFGTNSQELETLMKDAIFFNITLSDFLRHPGEKSFLIPLIVYFCAKAQDKFLSRPKE